MGRQRWRWLDPAHLPWLLLASKWKLQWPCFRCVSFPHLGWVEIGGCLLGVIYKVSLKEWVESSDSRPLMAFVTWALTYKFFLISASQYECLIPSSICWGLGEKNLWFTLPGSLTLECNRSGFECKVHKKFLSCFVLLSRGCVPVLLFWFPAGNRTREVQMWCIPKALEEGTRTLFTTKVFW